MTLEELFEKAMAKSPVLSAEWFSDKGKPDTPAYRTKLRVSLEDAQVFVLTRRYINSRGKPLNWGVPESNVVKLHA